VPGANGAGKSAIIDAAQTVLTGANMMSIRFNTTHMLRLLPHTSFERPVHVPPAWGGRLTQFSGDRWIACGDAAACFDPISSQGIFSALHSGNEAGLAVADALRRRNEKLGRYSERMETVWKSYSGRLRSVYRMERRWPRELFWSSLANDYR
jgi:flavin-dependent dehydrogenase